VSVLQRLAAHETKLRRRLEQAPWLDAFAQQEIHQSESLARRADRQQPELEDLVGESRFLFQAAREAVIRAREWLGVFEDSFAEESRPVPSEWPSAGSSRSAPVGSPPGSG